MNEETIALQKRLIDLSLYAEKKEIVTFSDFLTLGELQILHQSKDKLLTQYQIFGGYNYAERQIVAFIPDALYYDWSYPITCLCFTPSYPKFAKELGHRDYLGAIMNLGIKRQKIGDIKNQKQDFYIFCSDNIASFLCSELTTVGNTTVQGKKIDASELTLIQNFEEITTIVSSLRLDTILSGVTKLSRSKSLLLIQSQKVFINGTVTTENAKTVKEKDLISVRGYGKFRFDGILFETKKKRFKITIQKYI